MNGDGEDRPKLTIVGGQPHRRPRGADRAKIKVPVGLEKILFHAAGDPEFCTRLLQDPVATVRETGIRLRPSESAVLAALSPDAIEKMIQNLVPENPRRRKFMGLVAAAAASLAAGTAKGCYETKGTDHIDDTGPVLDTAAGAGPDTATETIGDSDADTETDIESVLDTNTETGTAVDTETDPPEIDAGDTGPDTASDTAVDGDSEIEVEDTEDIILGIITAIDVDGDF